MLPPGMRLAPRLGVNEWSYDAHRRLALVLTFVACACYHASRKPTSIVKSVLVPESHPLSSSSSSSSFPPLPWPLGPVFLPSKPLGEPHSDGWAPFNGAAKLGEIDAAFLSCYTVGLYAAGILGDSLDLRLFLAAGMIGSGAFVGLFGMGYFWHLHAFGFYLAMQMLAGLFQATGWPSVVAVVGNWLGEQGRGLGMGIWNACTSVGNIVGAVLEANVLRHGWGWSFVLPGALIALAGVLVFFFLAPYPEDLEFPSPRPREEAQGGRDQQAGRVRDGGSRQRGNAVGFARAFLIPGVIPFALCLFFLKLVANTLLYWLPYYLSHTAIGGEHVSVQSAGNLSSLFDVGAVFGGILAGFISDQLEARATTAASFMYLAIPALYAYNRYGTISKPWNITLMMITGFFVNGPCSLIATAVAVDLGTHNSLEGDSRALATVIAIIDGTGSVGAALGPLATGFLSSSGWGSVFNMLMSGAFVAGVLLSIQAKAEIARCVLDWRGARSRDPGQQGTEGSLTHRFWEAVKKRMVFQINRSIRYRELQARLNIHSN